MLLKTRIFVLLDRLLDFLPGHRNDANSLEARVRKVVERNTARLIQEAEHLEVVLKSAERRAEQVLEIAIKTAEVLHAELQKLDESRLIKFEDPRVMKAAVGLAIASGKVDLIHDGEDYIDDDLEEEPTV